MTAAAPGSTPCAMQAFVERVGRTAWMDRIGALKRGATPGVAGRALLRRHCVELAVERLRRAGPAAGRSQAESRVAELVADTVALADELPDTGRARLTDRLRAAVQDDATLVPLLHLIRTARLQRARGFAVHHAGFADGAPFDLLIHRAGAEAEIVCDTVSAEDGRDVHRGAWFRLVDRVDPDLQSWLAAHPGRYLLKMTLPRGLRGCDGEGSELACLHRRITRLLAEHRRAEHDEAAVLRLDPLMLAAAQANESGLMLHLRREFGPEAHLAVTAAGGGVFVMAARAGREDGVAAAVRRRMAELAPARLTGSRPGILAMFVEDTDRVEWRSLRDQLTLEGEARQFLTTEAARAVIAVTCASRLEMFGECTGDDERVDELRFRNPRHPQAGVSALAPAVLSHA